MDKATRSPGTCAIALLTASVFLAVRGLQAQAPAPAPAWQTAAGGKMDFDVASIHLAEPGKFTPPNFALSPSDSVIPPGGRFFADFPLVVYVTFAYKIWPTQEETEAMFSHLPAWAKTQSFMIEAKAEGNPTKNQMRLMVQSLLADRFKLAVHFESQMVPVYALVLAKPGELGLKLQPHDKGPPCDTSVPPAESGAKANAPAVFPSDCDSYQMMRPQDHTIELGSRNTTMVQMADSLPGPGRLGRPVIDQTGLQGKFDFTLQWTLENDSPPATSADVQLDLAGPSFLGALKDQLGLKLKPTKAPIQVLVIDHVEWPTPN